MSVVDQLRRGKHAAFVAYKKLRWPVYEATEPWVQAYHRRFPVRYDAEHFPGAFWTRSVPLTRETTEPVPRRIFCFWTGDNDMSADRSAAWASIQSANPDVDVLLITPRTLPDWLLPEAPLHPAYQHLHYVHRADYLRCYFLHFHGGGYADIKHTDQSWAAAFDRMDASQAWLMGSRNPIRLMTPNFADPRLERWMRRTSDQRLDQCGYISRPRTPLSHEWWEELNVRLDGYAEALARHPGDSRGSDPLYPIQWNAILAQILDPLTVKYATHLLYEPTIFMSRRDYM